MVFRVRCVGSIQLDDEMKNVLSAKLIVTLSRKTPFSMCASNSVLKGNL